MENDMDKKLTGIPETMLIALWARAFETNRKDPIVKDPMAVEMVSRIDYDFTKFEKSWLSLAGVSIRTMLLDKATVRFLQDNPNAQVVNLGAGLDTRFERIGKESVQYWYDLDVSEGIELRKRFFTESKKNRFIAKSAYDLSWTDEIDTTQPVLLIAEGLLMYFSEAENKAFFKGLAQKLPGAEMLFEMLAPAAVGNGKRHDALKRVEKTPEFKWGIKNSRDVEAWHQGIRYITEWNYLDYYNARWGWFGYIARLPIIKPYLSQRIVHIRYL